MAEPRIEPKAAVPSHTLSGTIADRFVIGNLLGAGGMAEVYRAEDTQLRRVVALKRISPAIRNDESKRRRLWREAERASKLNDRYIAAVLRNGIQSLAPADRFSEAGRDCKPVLTLRVHD